MQESTRYDDDLVQCCGCLRTRSRGVRSDAPGAWSPAEARLPVTHGLCPGCADVAWRELVELFPTPAAPYE